MTSPEKQANFQLCVLIRSMQM